MQQNNPDLLHFFFTFTFQISKIGCLSNLRFYCFLYSLLLYQLCWGQTINNIREKTISFKEDTIDLDSLSILPNSLIILSPDDQYINADAYSIDYVDAILIWNKNSPYYSKLNYDSLKIIYRVFPFSLTASYQHKDFRLIEKSVEGVRNPFTMSYENTTNDLFKFEGLNKNGSISRGITFGNNQDVVVNSNLNLQLSGKLGENINILAAITDENIPIQPEGNTQQLQDFDKVFIQLWNEKNKLILGDFELQRPNSYFMNFYKKALGGSYVGNFKAADIINPELKGTLKLGVSGAISKGKFARNPFNGSEGNQGPYRLTGANNESFIIILSGSEKVFINGELLVRGQNNDYTIDYNLAEITFTTKRLITKDSRILIEFEYSEKNFVHSLLYFNAEYEEDKLKLRFNAFTEQDSKNLSLNQELTSEQKDTLENIGDSLHLAIFPSVDSIAFNTDQILYKKIDTTVASVTYSNVYVYSTSSDSAFYSLGFSSVGQGMGNYMQTTSAANGKVFKWVAPVNGIPQGSYEPIVLLVTPKKQQLYTFGVDYIFSKNSKTSVELALSNNDVNLFSEKHKEDNVGYALRVNFQNIKTFPKKHQDRTYTLDSWKIISFINYEQVDQNFKPIERYRNVEFERDWNLGNVVAKGNDYLTTLNASANNKNLAFNYQLKSLLKGKDYNAFTNVLSTKINWKGFKVVADGSLLKSNTPNQNTNYLRQKADLSRNFRILTLGIREEYEKNRFYNLGSDTLLASSFAFNEWQAYIINSDTASAKFNLSYSQRQDYAPLGNSFSLATLAENVNFSSLISKNSNSSFNTNITYRRLSIVNDSLSSLQSENNSLLTRIEYNKIFRRGLISTNTFYEIGTGQEVKKEFFYIEVSPGQGAYSWTDYNNNEVKELNEFEIAAFADQANYIKVYTPTNEYIKTYSNSFNEVLSIAPAVVWQSKKGIKKFIGRFYNQALMQLNRKTLYEDILTQLNPFIQEVEDSSLITVNSLFRNTLYFNRSSPKFGLDISWQDNRHKTLLTNGFEYRTLTDLTGNIRYNIFRVLTLSTNYKTGKKVNSSEFFSTRDYSINYMEAEPKLRYQASTTFRSTISYRISQKENEKIITTDSIYGGEIAVIQKSGLEIKYSTLKAGNIVAKASLINIFYNSEENTSLAFEMLEGFKKGQNLTWSLAMQRNLSNNTQLSVMYEGRKSEASEAIHNAGVQIRAFF